MLRKLILWFQIRALEAMIDGRDSIRHMVSDTITLANMDLLQSLAHSEFRRLKREYLK